jgi:hypothetical protein
LRAAPPCPRATASDTTAATASRPVAGIGVELQFGVGDEVGADAGELAGWG